MIPTRLPNYVPASSHISPYGSSYPNQQPATTEITREEQEMLDAIAASEVTHREEQQLLQRQTTEERLVMLVSQWSIEQPRTSTSSGYVPSAFPAVPAPTSFPVSQEDADYERALAESERTHNVERNLSSLDSMTMSQVIHLSNQTAAQAAQQAARLQTEEDARLAAAMATSKEEAERAARQRDEQRLLEDYEFTQAMQQSQIPVTSIQRTYPTASTQPTYVVKVDELADLQAAIAIAKTDSKISIIDYETTINSGRNVELKLNFDNYVRANIAVEQLRTNHGMFSNSEPIREGRSIQLSVEQTKVFFDTFFMG